MTSTATTTAQYVATQHNRLNCSVSRVTPMVAGMELVEYVGAADHNLPADVQALLDGARGTGMATGSRQSTYSDGAASLTWYANANSAPRRSAGVHVAPVSADSAQVALAARCAAQSRTTPAAGDRWVVSTTTGYLLVQNRDLDHRHCSCGNGTTTYAEGTVTGLTHWADNSVDVHVALDGGGTRTVQVTAPHGDICF